MKKYSVSFMVTSCVGIHGILTWILEELSSDIVQNLFIGELEIDENGFTRFWQQSRCCDCGSHFFKNGSMISKVVCLKCSKEFDIQ